MQSSAQSPCLLYPLDEQPIHFDGYLIKYICSTSKTPEINLTKSHRKTFIRMIGCHSIYIACRFWKLDRFTIIKDFFEFQIHIKRLTFHYRINLIRFSAHNIPSFFYQFWRFMKLSPRQTLGDMREKFTENKVSMFGHKRSPWVEFQLFLAMLAVTKQCYPSPTWRDGDRSPTPQPMTLIAPEIIA